MIMHKVTTLNQFIIERQAEIPGATGEFSRLLHHIGIAAKKVHREVNKAGLVDILGKVGSINVQGEDQQKLDVYADKTFMDEWRVLWGSYRRESGHRGFRGGIKQGREVHHLYGPAGWIVKY